MSWDYIRQWNAFMDRSLGTLTRTEVSLYMRLFQFNNTVGRVEWFSASNILIVGLTELDEKNLIKNRNSLKQKGFIDFIPGRKGQPTKYKLILLYENTGATPVKTPVKTPVFTPVNPPVETPVKTPDIIKGKSKSKVKKKNTTYSEKKPFVPPTLEEVRAYVKEKGLNVDADFFYAYYSEGSWQDKAGNPVKSWKQKCLTWSRRDGNKQQDPVSKSDGIDWSEFDG